MSLHVLLLDVAVEVLFEQAGVMRINTLEELFDVAALLGRSLSHTDQVLV